MGCPIWREPEEEGDVKSKVIKNDNEDHVTSDTDNEELREQFPPLYRLPVRTESRRTGFDNVPRSSTRQNSFPRNAPNNEQEEPPRQPRLQHMERLSDLQRRMDALSQRFGVGQNRELGRIEPGSTPTRSSLTGLLDSVHQLQAHLDAQVSSAEAARRGESSQGNASPPWVPDRSLTSVFELETRIFEELVNETLRTARGYGNEGGGSFTSESESSSDDEEITLQQFLDESRYEERRRQHSLARLIEQALPRVSFREFVLQNQEYFHVPRLMEELRSDEYQEGRFDSAISNIRRIGEAHDASLTSGASAGVRPVQTTRERYPGVTLTLDTPGGLVTAHGEVFTVGSRPSGEDPLRLNLDRLDEDSRHMLQSLTGMSTIDVPSRPSSMPSPRPPRASSSGATALDAMSGSISSNRREGPTSQRGLDQQSQAEQLRDDFRRQTRRLVYDGLPSLNTHRRSNGRPAA